MKLLEAEDVRVEFGKLTALAGVSLEVAEGDLVGLIGPNGAGKTTLLRVLAGLQPPTSGTARVQGEDLYSTLEPSHGHVGFAPDAPPAYDELAVEQFLRVIAQAYDIIGRQADERIGHWLDQLWLTEKRDQKIANLSRGMRQRVTLAQTLLPSPRIVLLDEPSSGLDPAGRIQLRHVIASLREQGKAVIVSSHILADLEEYCTHIAIIEHGRLLRYERVSELQEATRHARYRMTFVADVDASALLVGFDELTLIEQDGRVVTLDYLRDEDAVAEFLKAVILQGGRICEFEMIKTTLEDVYLQTGVRQVD
jgi:ABC-2 type transport system ATP-binding protein